MKTTFDKKQNTPLDLEIEFIESIERQPVNSSRDIFEKYCSLTITGTVGTTVWGQQQG